MYSQTVALASILLTLANGFVVAQELEMSAVTGDVELQWVPEPGKQYSIDRSFDLELWSNAGVFGSGASVALFPGPDSFSRQFFRLSEEQHPLESIVTQFHSFDTDLADPRIADLPSPAFSFVTDSGYEVDEGRSGSSASFTPGDLQKWSAPLPTDFSTNGDSFFFSLWINKSSSPTVQSIFSKAGEYLLYELNGDVAFSLNRSTPNTVTVKTTGSPLQSGVWHHVLIWYDLNVNGLNLQVDGGEVFTKWAAFGAGVSTNQFCLGYGVLSSNTQRNWFNGRIDDLCFANARLGDYEAEVLYRDGSGVSYPFELPMLSPEAMEEATITSDYADDTPLRVHPDGGTTENSAIIGAGRVFANSLEQFDELETAELCAATGDFTISFWSRLDSDDEAIHPILGKPAQGGGYQYAFYRTSQSIGVQIDVSSGVIILEAPCAGDGGWVHATLSVESVTGTAILYVDGVEVTNATLQGAFGAPGGALTLGRASLEESGVSVPVHGFFSGCIDEFRFHRRVLKGREIESNYLRGKGVACWGDSFTAGPGAISYTETLEASRGIKVSNHGIFGANAIYLNSQMAKNSVQSSWVTVIWVGWTTHTQTHSMQTTESGLASMVQQLHSRRPDPRFVIVNIANHHHPDWESGGEEHPDFHRALIEPINQMIATNYPDNYIDLDNHFINDYVSADPLDQADQAVGIIPRSLRINLNDGDQNFNDDTHLTSAGYAEVAGLVDAFLEGKGW